MCDCLSLCDWWVVTIDLERITDLGTFKSEQSKE